ncbi:DUF397 domain-containing protein [Streptomyces sp. NPDC001780]
MAIHPQSAGGAVWFKSSYSGAGTTECVEAAHLQEGTAVRDSKDPSGPWIVFPAGAWTGFLATLKD